MKNGTERPGYSSLDMIEQCITRVSDPSGEGARAFIDVYSGKAQIAARVSDILPASGYTASPTGGMPLSIKDLLDVGGKISRTGSPALDDASPAERDALVVQRLKSAGAISVGRTNITPFAYLLVGLNAQLRTPAMLGGLSADWLEAEVAVKERRGHGKSNQP